MKTNLLTGLAAASMIFMSLGNAYGTIITYNFGGYLTLVSDPSSLLGQDRNFQIGDSFQAIYSIDTETPMTSGTIGAGTMTNSYFSDAVLNFQFYVNNINLVNSSYRVQSFRNINGMINGKPADWIEIITDGGVDNYGDSYGKNSYNEFIDSELRLIDLTGTALDGYNKTYTGCNASLGIGILMFPS